MADRGKAAKFQAIIRNLVDEAQRNTPAFSEALHARVCEAVRRKAAEAPSPAVAARRRWSVEWAILGAVAAMLLVAVALGLTWRGLGGFGPADQDGRGGAPVAQRDGTAGPERSPDSPEGALAARDGALPTRSTLPEPPRPETPAAPSVAVDGTAGGTAVAEVAAVAEEEAPTVPEIASLVGGGLAQSQWAYLAYDLRLGADLLAEQFPYELAEIDEP